MPSPSRLSPSPQPYTTSSAPNPPPQTNSADNQTSLQDNTAVTTVATNTNPPVRLIYAGAGKRPRQLTASPESDSGSANPASNTGTAKKLKLQPTGTQQLATPKSEAERIAEGLASLEDRNALHAAMLSQYAAKDLSSPKYQTRLPENSISTPYMKGLEALGYDDDKQIRRPDRKSIENAIKYFKTAADVSKGLIEPEIPLLSARNLILIYLQESPENQQSGLLDALRQGLKVAAAITDSNALSVIDTNSTRQTPKKDLARIYQHAMKHWDLFPKEEKGLLRSRMLQQMETNEVFLDITYGEFRSTVFADAYVNNTDEQSRQEFVEALRKRVEQNKTYKHRGAEDNYSSLFGALNLLNDVHAEQWKKEPTPANLEQALTDIETLMQGKRTNWNKGSAVLRFSDLFIHADDPGMKKQIAAKAAGTMKMMTDLYQDHSSGELLPQISYSRVALAKMILHHLAEEGNIDKDSIQKLLFHWLPNSYGYISHINFDRKHFNGTLSGKPRHNDQDRLVLLKCACEAASLIIEISQNENISKLTPAVFESIAERLQGEMKTLSSLTRRQSQSQDEGFMEMNRYLKMHIKKVSSGMEFSKLFHGVPFTI